MTIFENDLIMDNINILEIQAKCAISNKQLRILFDKLNKNDNRLNAKCVLENILSYNFVVKFDANRLTLETSIRNLEFPDYDKYMTLEKFNTLRVMFGDKLKYRGKWYRVVSVDFKDKTFAIESFDKSQLPIWISYKNVEDYIHEKK